MLHYRMIGAPSLDNLAWTDAETVSSKTYSNITCPCVYGWFRKDVCLYIGSSAQGIYRFLRHQVIGMLDDVLPTDEFKFLPVENIKTARKLEASLIQQCKPRFNVQFNGRGYLTSRIIEQFLKVNCPNTTTINNTT